MYVVSVGGNGMSVEGILLLVRLVFARTVVVVFAQIP